MTSYRSVDPRTGALRGLRPEATDAEVDAALAEVTRGFQAWSRAPVADRAAALTRLAAVLRAHAAEDARLMAEEMGKPLSQGLGEIEKCAATCAHLAAHGPAWLTPEPVPSEARRSEVRFDPLGPVLAIMPWNFPYWQVIRAGAPALLAGNTLVLKHAPNVPDNARALVARLRAAGLGPELVAELPATLDQTSRMVADPRVAAVTLTGSARAGRAVASLAGQHLKPSVLELGGSDPFIVLADADLDQAVEVAARARLQNNGQSCIAAKRFLVERPVAAAFTERLAARMAAFRVGDPVDPTTEVGPMARLDLRDELADQVSRTLRQGGRAVVGGAALARPGWWYPPTLVADLPLDAPMWTDETFGPAGAVVAVDDADQAIDRANDSRYGLGAALWTSDLDRAAALAARLRAGSVFINDMVRSDVRFPVGGLGWSGWGRELGREGVRQLTIIKTVWTR